MLNLKVEGAFYERGGDTAHRIAVTEPAPHIGFRQSGINGGDERLDIRPEDVELRAFRQGLPPRVIAVAFQYLLDPRIPLGELAVIRGDRA